MPALTLPLITTVTRQRLLSPIILRARIGTQPQGDVLWLYRLPYYALWFRAALSRAGSVSYSLGAKGPTQAGH